VHTAENDGARSERGASLNDGGKELPILFRLQLPPLVRRPRMLVVDEDDSVADEDFVLDADT